MTDLIQLGEHTYYFPNDPNVGLFVVDRLACLIDSGASEKQADDILRLIRSHNWDLAAVFNTHYHADHVGGNRYLQDATGCECFCPMAYLANDPILNPSQLYGAYPPRPFHEQPFLAPACHAQELTPELLPEGLKAIELPGHCRVQLGIQTCDGVFFCADALIGKQQLSRYAFSHLYHLGDYLSSLAQLEATAATWYVPSHEIALQDIHPLVMLNRQSCQNLISWILDACVGDGLTHDALLKVIFDRAHRRLHLAQYALSGCTLRAYLSYLLDRGLLTLRVADNLLYFCTAQT